MKSVNLCYQIYETEKSYDSTFTVFAEHNIDGVQFDILFDSDIVYVVYRGTDEIIDILKEIQMCSKSIGKGFKIHRGIHEYFRKSKECIDHTINISQPIKVVFCGHSLGGCLAQFAAYFYSGKGISCESYSFGSPAFVNRSLSTDMNHKNFYNCRITLSNDHIVKLFPFYVHAGNHIKLYNSALFNHSIDSYRQAIINIVES